MDALRDLADETTIENLSIPYTAVAVDIDTQREAGLSRGSLFDTIRASIATPAIFRPYLHHARTLVDGGLLNPVPPARSTSSTGAEELIEIGRRRAREALQR